MDALALLPPGKACAKPTEGLDAKGELLASATQVSLVHPSPLSGPI